MNSNLSKGGQQYQELYMKTYVQFIVAGEIKSVYGIYIVKAFSSRQMVSGY